MPGNADAVPRHATAVPLLQGFPGSAPVCSRQVVIDNMMNLELLFVAAALPGGKSEWRDIAVAHASTASKVFFRPDGSTYHKVIYDLQTGEAFVAVEQMLIALLACAPPTWPFP